MGLPSWYRFCTQQIFLYSHTDFCLMQASMHMSCQQTHGIGAWWEWIQDGDWNQVLQRKKKHMTYSGGATIGPPSAAKARSAAVNLSPHMNAWPLASDSPTCSKAPTQAITHNRDQGESSSGLDRRRILKYFFYPGKIHMKKVVQQQKWKEIEFQHKPAHDSFEICREIWR